MKTLIEYSLNILNRKGNYYGYGIIICNDTFENLQLSINCQDKNRPDSNREGHRFDSNIINLNDRVLHDLFFVALFCLLTTELVEPLIFKPNYRSEDLR